ncbi:hypothetical protein HHK36_001546 [Tetracentron sinense]|uniref:Uncharacterized protein n=1 Tax=Tetracentron sinense TaxID=13715 RepID=A0A834ZTM4_TETSI|nr:hypothetical protein HHK36_001546 [Tetracentron sinense]
MDNISSVSERRVVRQGTGSAQPGFQDDESARRSVVIADEENIVTKDWLISMKDGDEHKKTQIQKVPPMLRLIKDNKEFYDPMVVSIGPYHHGKSELNLVENLKLTIARKFVKESGKEFDDFYNEFVKRANNPRQFYDEQSTSDFDDKMFIYMMFLDGCFVLHFIGCVTNTKLHDMQMKLHHIVFVRQDLFLLENQLPYVVLKTLMSLRFSGDEGEKMMKEFIKGEVMPPSRSGDKPQKGATNFHAKKIGDGGDGQPLHLLELLRTELVGECKDPSPGASQDGDWQSYRSVEELNTVGINFTRSDTFHLHDVSYKSHLIHGELSLPPIAVDDSTKHKFLNLIAYETCPDAPEDYTVTSYVCFLDSLIDNDKDVKELRSKGILLNSLGSDQQVADLFNQLSNNLVPDPIVYGDVKGKIEKHYKNKCKIWMAEINHTHFSSPWSVIALLAGVFVIVITVIQTYFTVFPLKKDENPQGAAHMSSFWH